MNTDGNNPNVSTNQMRPTQAYQTSDLWICKIGFGNLDGLSYTIERSLT